MQSAMLCALVQRLLDVQHERAGAGAGAAAADVEQAATDEARPPRVCLWPEGEARPRCRWLPRPPRAAAPRVRIPPLYHSLEALSPAACELGASVATSADAHVTHVVANAGGTEKVRWAARQPSVRAVSLEWLTNCGAFWRHEDEEEYPLADPPQAAE